MTKEQIKIICQAWKGLLWSIPKKPTCLFDKVELLITKKPQKALEQNILDNNAAFWGNHKFIYH